MTFTSKGMREVIEVPWGVLLWQMPDGSFVSDGEGRFLMVASTRDNKQRYEAMARAVAEFGITEGKCVWFHGHRPVTDEEYEEQRQRLEWGLTPDLQDVASIKEDYDNVRRHNSKR